MAKPLFVDQDSFDLVQQSVLNDGFANGMNCVVRGCAGSGKSCVAMNIWNYCKL